MLPFLPARNRLPARYRIWSWAGGIESELRSLEKYCRGGATAIDVGANHGLYSYRFSHLFQKVHSFEINEGLVGELESFNPGNIVVHTVGLSDCNSTATLYTPVFNGVELHGWASLAPGNCPDTDQHITKTVQVQRLDDFGLQEVGFMKIDVEGHELFVLRGGQKTISTYLPDVLIEVRDNNLDQVRRFFSELGYGEVPLRQAVGIVPSLGNYFFSHHHGT
jgi:FkbM family methyltransferase